MNKFLAYLKSIFDSVLSILLFLIVILLYYFSKIDGTLLLGFIGAIATLYFGILKHKIENDKVFHELFTTFNSKYDIRFNDLINELKVDSNRSLIPTEKNLIIDYLNLCAEEYLWTAKNRIPKSVWEAWKAGIIQNLKIKQIREIFDLETSTINGRKSFYGLYEEIKKDLI